MLKVFLSSTFKDLIAERNAVESVIHRINANFIGMEHFGSFAEEPLKRCLRKVNSADVVILVVAGSYGSIPKGYRISFTEAEYRRAKWIGKPVLPYFADRNYYNFPLLDTKTLDFQKKIQSFHGVSLFTSPEDLAWKVACDLAREFSNHISTPDVLSIDTFGERILLEPIKDRIDELITILENRAKRIYQELHHYYQYAQVRDYLRQFKQLHRQHIECLKKGMIIGAHDLLVRIHEISFELERDEFWHKYRKKTPFIRYKLSRNSSFQRGMLICEYIAGEMKAHSKEYTCNEGFIVHINGGKMVSPLVSVKLYENILYKQSMSRNEI